MVTSLLHFLHTHSFLEFVHPDCASICDHLKRRSCAGLAVGSYSAWFVRILIFLCFPVGDRTCCRTL